jgi:hypothetical protein
MKTNHQQLRGAAANALRIGGEYAPLGITPFLTTLQRPTSRAFEEITEAAAILAELEAMPGFEWHEGGRTDWETCCARIAKGISEQSLAMTSKDIAATTRARYKQS